MAQSPAPTAPDAMSTGPVPQQSPSKIGVKRRQSEVSEQENKRLRGSPGKTSSTPEPTHASAPRDSDAPSEDKQRRDSIDQTPVAQSPSRADTRRRSSAINEKDRSRRLFGGLLGSLSQKGDSRTAKRRQEIESRKKAELQRQDDELVEDKQRRLEALAEKRGRVKKRLESESMRNRHRNMLHSANFLRTSAQPRLLYKPWELRDEEEDRIDDQISEAKAQIERELDKHDAGATAHHETNGDGANVPATTERPQAEDVSDVKSATAEPANAPNVSNEKDTTTTATADSTDDATNTHPDGTGPDEHASSKTGDLCSSDAAAEVPETSMTNQDEHDDHVVEGEEDTAIY